MSGTPVRRRVDALAQLAGGASNRAAAEAAGVAAGTVSSWRRDPVFAEELAGVRAVVERRPVDVDAIMARLAEAEERLAPAGPRVNGDGSVSVSVAVPAGVSPRVRERLVARAVARGVARALRERS